MKNLFKSLMLVAVAAMAFTACQKDVDELNKVSEGTTVTFSANFGADTRATLTDEDNDGVFKAAWAEGDKVNFVAYNGEEYIEAVLVEVAEAGATTEFTVNFKNTLAEGTVIKAFLNQYYDSYYERIDKYNSLSSQYVKPNIQYVYASAETVYGGEAIGDLTFSHDVAYACMTLGCDCDEPCRFTYAKVTFTDVDGNSDYYYLYGDDAENNKFWFTAEAVANLAKLEVSAQDEFYENYEYVRVFEAGKALKAGVLYTFTVDAWATRLEQPKVEGTIDGTTATFTWTEVENATGYEVSVNNGEYVAVEGTEYTVYLTGYNPFASVNLRVKAKGDGAVYLDSYEGSSSVTVPISKDAAGDEGYSFEYDQFMERGTNMYKFYNSTEKEYMYVKFSQDITTLEPGSYTYTLGNGVVSGTADSAFRHPTYDNGAYLEWWFQGDFMMFVDVTAEGAYTITTFCKRGIDYNGDWMNDAEPLYKSVWRGSFGVVEPEPEPEPVKLYLNPGPWAVDGAWFAAYFFGDDINAWATMTLVEGKTDVYELVVPDGGYTHVIFVRMNPASTTPSFDDGSKWNQTGDLVLPADENTYYTVTGWGNFDGSWGVYTPGQGGENPEPEPEPEPGVTYDYEVAFTSATFANGVLQFVGANETDYLNLIINPGLSSIVAGEYVGNSNQDYEAGYPYPILWTSENALEVDSYNSTFDLSAQPSTYAYYISNVNMTVSVAGDVYTIVVTGTSYIGGPDKTVKFTYTGAISTPTGPDLTGYSEGSDGKCIYNGGSGTVKFTAFYKDSVCMKLYPLFDSDTSKKFEVGGGVEELTLSGIPATSGTVKVEKVSDDTFVVMVDATFNMVGSQKFYFYTTLVQQ